MSDTVLRAHSKPRCLVVGGAGFLGSNLAEDLLSRGYRVSIYDIQPSVLDESVTSYQADICDLFQLSNALQDCEIVFNCVTPPPLLGYSYWALFNRVNVQGLETLIRACRQTGVKKLVHTSTAYVVYNGVDMANADEQLPYSTKPLDNYVASKILQEQIVLRANSSELMTCAIRPNGMFGPRDPYSIPGLLDAAKNGNRFIIGTGKNLIDFTYVRNVTHGLILAAESLQPGSVSCGAAYNITNECPILMWEFATRVISRYNPSLPLPTIPLPYSLMYVIALILTTLCRLISPIKRITPALTPLKVSLCSTHAYCSCEKAKLELGYAAKYSMEEGIETSLSYFKKINY